MREVGINKSAIYFISNSLARLKTFLQKIEKTSLGLVVASRKLRHYLITHLIVVCINQPSKHVHFKTDLVGRTTKCFVDISEFYIFFELKKHTKSTCICLFYFIVNFTHN